MEEADIGEEPDKQDASPRRNGQASGSLPRRLLWFAVLWLGGLVVIGGGAYGLRALIGLFY